MPNGGPDNCSTCGLNRNHAGQWGQRSDHPGFCTIRNVAVLAPHWTYCKNWHSRSTTPTGPIYFSVYEDGYRRVPWLRSIEPTAGAVDRCAVCTQPGNDGIQVTLPDGGFGFCGRAHYLAWRETRMIGEMRQRIAAGEQAYSEMYDSRSPAGLYSAAKDYFSDARRIASELELVREEQEMAARLEHIKNVFRSQFG